MNSLQSPNAIAALNDHFRQNIENPFAGKLVCTSQVAAPSGKTDLM